MVLAGGVVSGGYGADDWAGSGGGACTMRMIGFRIFPRWGFVVMLGGVTGGVVERAAVRGLVTGVMAFMFGLAGARRRWDFRLALRAGYWRDAIIMPRGIERCR